MFPTPKIDEQLNYDLLSTEVRSEKALANFAKVFLFCWFLSSSSVISGAFFSKKLRTSNTLIGSFSSASSMLAFGLASQNSNSI